MCQGLFEKTITRQKYEFDCTQFWEITSIRILGEVLSKREKLKCCPDESSFLEETGKCDGPPAWCRPDCFGCIDNPLMEWSEWSEWSRIHTGFSVFFEERYKQLKCCQNRQNYYPVKQRQERRVPKRGKQRFEYLDSKAKFNWNVLWEITEY